MEVPSAVLLYAALAAAAAGLFITMYYTYQGIVSSINQHACVEVASLIELGAQRGMAEAGNYTFYIRLPYTVVLRENGTVQLEQATCQVQCRDCRYRAGVGREVVVLKNATWKKLKEGGAECGYVVEDKDGLVYVTSRVSRLVRVGGELMYLEGGLLADPDEVEVECPVVEVYVR